MNSRQKLTLKKFLFLRHNLSIALMCFKDKEKSYDWKTHEARTLVSLAREELKFSIKTCGEDIYMSLRRTFEKFRYHFVEGKSIHEQS
jgi:hypothetical protein